MRNGKIAILILWLLLFRAGINLCDAVILRNGRVMMISSYALEGANLKLQLKSGGEAVCPVFSILKIERQSIYSSREEPAGLADKFGTDREGICRIIEHAAVEFDMDAFLVAAIIAVESNFDARAISPKGAKGLMQLMPETATMYRVKDVFNPRENIECGIRHLKTLMAVYDDNLELVLAAYNAGEGAVQKHHGIPPYKETQDYVSKVTALYETLTVE